MDLLLAAWLLLCIFHLGIFFFYYMYMRRVAEKYPWNVLINEHYRPTITVIIPTYNEKQVMQAKFENLSKIDYPKDRLNFIVVDSASTDGTPDEVETIIKKYSDLNIKILREPIRLGKSHALNLASQHADSDIVATTDADCLWASDSLKNAVAYMYDRSIGAVSGREVLINPNQSSVTRTESQYRKMFNYIRMGESKIHSTLFFEGALALYKRSLLQRFDESCDDSGTALDLVQRGFRTILVPAVFLNPFPPSWKTKIIVKTRRAQHLIEICYKCLKLNITRRLKLHPLISGINLFLHIFNPFMFLVFMFISILILVKYPILALAIPLTLVIPQLRYSAILYVSNHIILLYALFRELFGKKQFVWEKGR